MADKETERCCKGCGDHEEWCWLYQTGASQRYRYRGARPVPKLAKRMKRVRNMARLREQQILAARVRVLPEPSSRVAAEPSRLNAAFAGLEDAYNEAVSASLQTEEAWRKLWDG